MAGHFDEDQIEEVRQANDIVEVIREYVPLKRAGKDFKALCPFHNEKTASFQVSPSKQIFKCFGCGKGGNVFTFVMSQERLEFPEAVELLARRAGIELKRDAQFKETHQRRESLFEMNLWAAQVYHRYLMNAEKGPVGRDYLSSRGLTEATWKKFRLGYAPPDWDFLVGLGGGKGLSPGDLEAAGLALARQGGGGHYDRFRNRVIFPIRDVRGRVVGFGGRALDDAKPKYLNSPETSAFNKSNCLYGLDAAKDAVLKQNRVVVVEGYTDCLMAHQHGVEFVVATLGTALTVQHIGTLRRYADEVLVVFDGDDAGKNAAERSADLFVEQDVDVRVVLLPGSKDPCDMLLEEGAEGFLARLGAASDVFDLKMEMIAGRHDFSRVKGREAAVEELLETLAKTTSPIRLDMLLGTDAIARLCREMGVTEKSLRERLGAMRRRTRGKPTAVEPTPARLSGILSAQREILATVLSDASLAETFSREVSPDDFSDPVLQSVAAAVSATIDAGQAVEVGRICSRLTDAEAVQAAVDMQHESEAKGNEPARFDAALRVIREALRKRRLADLHRQLAEAKSSGDTEKQIELLKQHQELMK